MKKYITNQILDHGLGSRILKIINLIGYTYTLKSMGHDVEFVYTPLTYEGFGFNFHSNQLFLYSPYRINNHRLDYLNVCDRWDKMVGVKGLKITDVNPDDVEFLVHPGDSTQEIFDNIRLRKDEIKDLLSLPPKEKKEYIDVAIHIRRGDVNIKDHPDRWIPDEYYLDVIKLIESELGDKCKITIYTQRRNFNSTLYSNYDVSYDDNSLDNEVWLKLIHADVLIMGKSAYSYSAGMLSDGVVIYYSTFHPKVYDWLDKDEIIDKLKIKLSL